MIQVLLAGSAEGLSGIGEGVCPGLSEVGVNVGGRTVEVRVGGSEGKAVGWTAEVHSASVGTAVREELVGTRVGWGAYPSDLRHSPSIPSVFFP